jgi:site-specific recombinase XerD
MSNDMVPPAPAPLVAAIDAAAAFAANSQAANTRRAYASDFKRFSSWCDSVRQPALPAAPETVAAYIGALAARGAKVKTIERRLTAIGDRHRRAGFDNPAAHPGVKATLSGIRRTLGVAVTKKAALTAELVAKATSPRAFGLVGGKSARLIDLRDRALILIGFAAALRRSELVDLNVNDIARHPKGIIITLRRSKTDQAGAGTVKAVPHGHKLKAVAALDAWLAALARADTERRADGLVAGGIGAPLNDSALFRGVRGTIVKQTRLCDRQVARIVKKRAAQIGLDAAAFAGHSLRSGFISSAADAGADLNKIADQAGHAKLDTTRGYVQVADAFRGHAGRKFL